jgi:hypothetical protein
MLAKAIGTCRSCLSTIEAEEWTEQWRENDEKSK